MRRTEMNLSSYDYSGTDEPNVYFTMARNGEESVHSVLECRYSSRSSPYSGPHGRLNHNPGAGCMRFPGMGKGNQKRLPTAGEHQPAHGGRNGPHCEHCKRSSF